MVNLSKTHKTTVQIADTTIAIRVARLTFEQSERHRREMNALDQTTKRQLHELEAADTTLTSEAHAALLALHAREDEQSEATARAAIEAYVTVEPNQIEVDGREVTSGKDLLDCFGTEPRLAVDLMYAIASGSSLSARLGKTFGSLSDSTRSSNAPDASGPGADGPRPEGTADVAERVATTEPAAVTVETDTPSSGSTATLN